MITLRRAGALDARPMSELLTQIIGIGGTTAMTDPVSAAELRGWMAQDWDRAAWHLAEDEAGTVLGFQWIAPHPKLPPQACDIASFVRVGQTGLGVGSQLFDRTRAAAKELGYRWINATIRTDNEGGLIYYQSRGFEVYDRRRDVELGNGQIVDQVLKRFDL